jgi:choline dehydrogenase-like flavoprotein
VSALTLDARALPDGARISADVCIVGAGPVGLSMAEALSQAGVAVMLLEGGDRDGTATGRDAGDVSGHPYFPLESTVARGIGGASRLWPEWDALRCLRLDPIDLTARPELSREGWPFGFDELLRWYPAAEAVCGLPAIGASTPTEHGDAGWDVARWEDEDHRILPLDSDLVTTRVARFGPADHFRTGRLAGVRHDRLRIVTNASVLEVVGDDTGRRVDHLVITSGERRATAHARCIVLAAGGIETARLLLLSRRPWISGAGNTHGLVGTHFMEHLHVWSGVLRPAVPGLAARLAFYERHHAPAGDALGLLAFPSEVLARESLPNIAVHLTPMPPALVTGASRALTSLVRRVRYRPRRLEAQTFRWATVLARHPIDAGRAAARRLLPSGAAPDAPVALMLQAEQLPNRRSRVVLGRRLDRHGQPVPVLDWRLSGVDIAPLGRAQRLVDGALRTAGLGVIDGFFDEEVVAPLIGGGRHHLGTARMASSPRCGVVDGDGRVFGIANLFVAGGATWPTGGFANPTLTSVALGLRTADRMAREMRTRPRIGRAR